MCSNSFDMEFFDTFNAFIYSPMDVFTDLEEWKVITGYPNYIVSSEGRVKNTKTGRILKSGKHTHGYKLVVLSKNCKTKTFTIHRLVALEFIPNTENKKCVDHIDGNPSNNVVSNLRWATVAENMQNSKIGKNNTSRFKGVVYHKAIKKYQANIRIDGKRKYLGLFQTAEEAGKAYNDAALKHFGTFARINDIK